MSRINMKMLSDTFVISLGEYNTSVVKAITSSKRIDKKSPEFEDILFDFKRRQTTNFLIDILMNNNVVLLYNERPLPRALTVIGAKDIATDKKTKIFVDCSGAFRYENQKYICKNIDAFIAIIISAFINLVYYSEESRIINNNNLVYHATECFVSLFTHILDYLRISGFNENKGKIEYMVSLYFLCNQLNMEYDGSAKNIAMKVSKLSTKDANIADILLPRGIDHFMNINVFINHLSSIFKFKELTTEVFMEKWLWQYGEGTQFALEFFPAFATMVAYAYSGTYVNKQMTIEKQCGKEMVEFVTAFLKIGHDKYRKY